MPAIFPVLVEMTLSWVALVSLEWPCVVPFACDVPRVHELGLFGVEASLHALNLSTGAVTATDADVAPQQGGGYTPLAVSLKRLVAGDQLSQNAQDVTLPAAEPSFGMTRVLMALALHDPFVPDERDLDRLKIAHGWHGSRSLAFSNLSSKLDVGVGSLDSYPCG